MKRIIIKTCNILIITVIISVFLIGCTSINSKFKTCEEWIIEYIDNYNEKNPNSAYPGDEEYYYNIYELKTSDTIANRYKGDNIIKYYRIDIISEVGYVTSYSYLFKVECKTNRERLEKDDIISIEEISNIN